MKKVLLAGTALLGVFAMSNVASAELKLDLGGYFRGYAAYADEDDSAAGARDFDFRRDTEVHFTGETTLDNGLTVGFHTEQALGNATTSGTSTDEVYAYFSGQWGRVNFGQEDGAAYLLQVAAPSADSNVDGLRNYIQATNVTNGQLDYDNAAFRETDRLTYLTPKFNGFQAGLSYAPQNEATAVYGGVAPIASTVFEDLWEASLRWDGEFNGFGISFGAGYASADNNTAASDTSSWDAGLNIAFNAFSVGAAYLDQSDFGGVAGADATTWVFGAAWDNGPYHAGVSYLNQDNDAATGFVDAERITVGGGYTFGPGMTFRGAVAFGNTGTVGTGDNDFTQVTLGTDIQF